MSFYRPKGVIALAIISLIIAAIGIILAIYYETTIMPQYSPILDLLYYLIFSNLGSTSINSSGINLIYVYLISVINIPLFQMEAVFSFIITETGIPTSIGLLRMEKWGYYLAVMFGILWIIFGVIGLMAVIGIVFIIFGIAVITYLLASDSRYYFESHRSRLSQRIEVRTPVGELEPKTRKTYRWQGERAGGEETKFSSPISKRLPKQKPNNTSTAEKNKKSGDLIEELETTHAKYKKTGTRVETMEKTEKETPPEKQITMLPDKKVERLKDLESEEEATQVLLEELKGRWTSGKIDIDMYQRLKEKYEKKIEHIEKQKKKLNKSTQL